jgi:hypothetical protein
MVIVTRSPSERICGSRSAPSSKERGSLERRWASATQRHYEEQTIMGGFAEDGGVASVFSRDGGQWTPDNKLVGSGAVYAESEDAGCMVGLQAAELPSADETAITDTATSPPKPKNSAFNSGY